MFFPMELLDASRDTETDTARSRDANADAEADIVPEGADDFAPDVMADGSLSTSHIREILAPLRGIRFLMESIGAMGGTGPTMGLQSWISTDPKFPESRTMRLEALAQTRTRAAARAGLGTASKGPLAMLGGGLPECFTSMLALKMLGPLLGPEAESLVAWVADKRLPAAPRYHFFADAGAIAADTDCTGVALSGLYRVGAISRELLRAGAEEILRSAAAEDVGEEDNLSHGKHNGQLIAGVFKVYWEDGAQGEAELRGRKHDPTCVANALHAVLLAVRHAGLRLDGTVQVHELLEDGDTMSRKLGRHEIVSRNIAYLIDCLERDSFAVGTRYYPSPDALLCFASELVRDFPEETASLRAPLLEALRMRWHAAPGRENDAACPRTAINLSMRLIAAQNLGLRESVLRTEIRALRRMQEPSGTWPAGALFKLGRMRCYFGSESMSTLFALRALLDQGSVHEGWAMTLPMEDGEGEDAACFD